MSKIDKELDKKKKALKRIYKFTIPIAIIGGLVYSFAYPYLPRKNGRKPIIEEMEYYDAVIQNAVLFFFLLFISMYYVIHKKKKKIKELERELYVKKKGTKKYNSVSSFKE